MNHEHPRESELVFEGAKFEVRQVALDGRDGNRQQRQVVVPSDAVVILPLLSDQRGKEEVVLIQNERFAVGKTLWELPAGTCEAGEKPAVTAGRELLEETGYEAATLERMTAFYPSPGFCTERLTAFHASGLTYRGQQLDATERITPYQISLSRALQMVRSGEIEDAKTIAALLYAKAYIVG